MSRTRPIIGITSGDPNGIGPEIALRTAADSSVRKVAAPVLIGSRSQFFDAARRFSLSANGLDIMDPGIPFVEPNFGRPDAKAGGTALAAVDAALNALKQRTIDAVATAPICKEAVVAAGHPGFAGHTGYLADFAGTPEHALALFAEDKTIAFVTLHVSLKTAVDSIRQNRIVVVGRLLHEFYSALGRPQCRIAVSGLNPHAGEHGLFGNEERDHIVPAVESLQGRGIPVHGPVPPDVAFPALFGGRYDAVVSMVHDHGHVAFKTLHFRFSQTGGKTGGVNVTLGLPFIRTSADHGTAFDIAGQGKGDAGSLTDALLLAARLVKGGYGDKTSQKD